MVRPDGDLDEDPILVLTLSAEHRRADAIAQVPCLAAVAELEGRPAAMRSGAVAAGSRAKHGPEVLTAVWSSVASRTD